jgi:hypothetical protein
LFSNKVSLGKSFFWDVGLLGAHPCFDQDFLTLWKDADPDISIPKQAKTEHAKLQ